MGVGNGIVFLMVSRFLGLGRLLRTFPSPMFPATFLIQSTQNGVNFLFDEDWMDGWMCFVRKEREEYGGRSWVASDGRYKASGNELKLMNGSCYIRRECVLGRYHLISL